MNPQGPIIGGGQKKHTKLQTLFHLVFGGVLSSNKFCLVLKHVYFDESWAPTGWRLPVFSRVKIDLA